MRWLQHRPVNDGACYHVSSCFDLFWHRVSHFSSQFHLLRCHQPHVQNVPDPALPLSLKERINVDAHNKLHLHLSPTLASCQSN